MNSINHKCLLNPEELASFDTVSINVRLRVQVGIGGTIGHLDDFIHKFFQREMGRIFNALPKVRDQIETFNCRMVRASVTCLGHHTRVAFTPPLKGSRWAAP